MDEEKSKQLDPNSYEALILRSVLYILVTK